MVVLPLPALLASPAALTVATAMSDESQFAWLVMFSTNPSLNVPTALNCCADPWLMLMLAGVMLMDTRVALVTVSVALPTCPANNAEIVVLPGVSPMAVPWLPGALLTVATAGADDVHATMPVKSRLSPLAKIPVVVKLVLMLAGTLKVAGATCSDARPDPSTTRFTVPLIVPTWAVITAIPADWPVAVPDCATVATCASEVVQVAAPFTERWLPSLNVPMALMLSDEPGARIALGAVSVSDTSVAEFTVSGANPLTPPKLALMLVLPLLNPVAVRIAPPPLPTVATAGLLEVQ